MWSLLREKGTLRERKEECEASLGLNTTGVREILFWTP